MSEPVAERLSRFTPERGGLDRDALLFAAGRASARPSRGWMALAGALAASQMLTLALFWPRPLPSGSDVVADAVAVAPAEVLSSPEPAPSALWALRQRLLEPGQPAPEPAAQDVIPDPPPLRVFPVSSDLLLD
jgi:hypothetical protein